ncbi:methyl-accepting chemotaxis protein [Psychromonas marina]|uniref:Methyl-accepting chemotaxis protein n=1 Tax=Psychromonas marina TaxID=88364 RepID=A0ABQ6DY70_9GAMM|nr:methyl-accepting chemotaxis protein [Psychromonas marina]GLS90025.1 methyl-accepting chemotaxis protein [Psychromonas marina]
MKVAVKVVLGTSLVLVLAISMLSFFQYREMTDNLRQHSSHSIEESSDALAQQVTNWLNSKIEVIDLISQNLDNNTSRSNIQNTFNAPVLKDQFILLFGGLETDGIAISNDPTWDSTGWDARTRPWYHVAETSHRATITEPYTDPVTDEIIISVVAPLTDGGQFKGAFGGDLSLKVVSDALNTLTFDDAGYAFLLAKDGNIISHPKIENNNKNYNQLFAGVSPSMNKQVQEIQVDGETLWVSFTALKDLRGMDWYIGVVVQESIVMADANAMGFKNVIGGILSVLISIVLLGAMMKKILQPIGCLAASLTEINSGNGDLTKRLPITSTDEFGDVARQFNVFIANLQGTITNVKKLASDVYQSNENVSNESEKASSELVQQLSELDQLATAMNEMASSAVEVANNAQVAAQSATTAGQETATGVAIVSNATDSINNLAVQMETAVESVVELANFSNNIESILTVITAIAEQTNLLALNAAIEAARAGESGRGFAVVADEVRSLASRTQESTSEIKLMIEQLQAGVRYAENNIKESREVAMTTAEEASKANDALDTIRDAIMQINDMNLQIASAAEQQSRTSEEINQNTTNIRDISQDVSNGAQQQAQYAKLMKQQVKEQDTQLNQFKV